MGGLSVLRVLRHHLKQENWVYFADSAHAPYGEKSPEDITERTLAITRQLRQRHGIKALVVACNTATAAAIATLREQHPDLPIVGIEPGIKPALAISQTRHIGVMATRRTVDSEKFQRLLASAQGQAQFTVQPCDGLALAIENQDHAKIEALIALYTSAMGTFGTKKGAIDTLVLGCTHYPLAAHQLHRSVGPHITLIDPAQGVTRQLERLLAVSHHLASGLGVGHITGCGTADMIQLQTALNRWCPPLTPPARQA
jgi:glutamate racemase